MIQRSRVQFHFILFLFFVAAVCENFSVVFSQEKKEPAKRETIVPQKKEEAPLPKIDLPEFLITGHENLETPATAKQEYDEDNIFSIGERGGEQRTRLDRGEQEMKLSKKFSKEKNILDGQCIARFGNYSTPSLEGWIGKTFDNGSIAGEAHYSSSDGHVTNAEWSRGSARVAGNYFLPSTQDLFSNANVRAEAGFSSEAYKAYASKNPTATRTDNAIAATIGMDSRWAFRHPSLESVDYSVNVHANSFAWNDSTNSTQNDFGIQLFGNSKYESVPVRASAEYVVSGISMSLPATPVTQAMHWFVLSSDARMMLTRSLQCSFGLQQFLYRGAEGATSGRLFPKAELRYFFTEGASLFTSFAPFVERASLQHVVAANRYALNTALLLPTVTPVHVSLGGEYVMNEQWKHSFLFSYSNADNYMTFLDSTNAKVWEVSYLPDVSTKRFEVRTHYEEVSFGSAEVFFSLRSVQQKDSTNSLPYLPNASAGILYHRTFAQKINVSTLLHYVSERRNSFASSDANAGYVYSEISSDYLFAPQMRAVLTITNVLDQQYYVWNGYREKGILLSLGISYAW